VRNDKEREKERERERKRERDLRHAEGRYKHTQ
jgi:hypothetical protein